MRRSGAVMLSFVALLCGVSSCWFQLVSPEDIVSRTVTVASDADDVMWFHCHDAAAVTIQSVHPNAMDTPPTFELFVSKDSSDCAPADELCDECAGFRFVSPIPKGAQVLEAYLELTISKTTLPSDANLIQIYVYDALDVAFDLATTSAIPPADIAPPYGAVSWLLGAVPVGEVVRSPDLAKLVQQLVDRGDYGEGAVLSLYLDGTRLPDTDGVFVGFRDSSGGSGARLVLRYLSPEGSDTSDASAASSTSAASTGGVDCISCADAVAAMVTDPTELCTTNGPPSSRNLYDAVQQCVCAEFCVSECSDACAATAEPTSDCATCIDTQCGGQLEACQNDP